MSTDSSYANPVWDGIVTVAFKSKQSGIWDTAIAHVITVHFVPTLKEGWTAISPVKNWVAENCQLILLYPLKRRMSAWASFESEAGRHIDRPCPQYTYRLPSTTPVTQPRFYADNFVIGSQLKIFSDWLCELQQLPLSALSLMAFLMQVWDWAVCSVHQLLSLSICSWCQALVAFDPACFGLVIQTRKCVLFHTGPPKEHLQQKKISSC